MTNFKIETSQNVNLEVTIASPADRCVGFFIDWVIAVAYGWLIIYILGEVKVGQYMFLLCYLPIYFYDIIFEFFNRGQTLGKMALRMRVINIDGTKETIGQIILRWIARLVDMYTFSLLVLFFGDSIDQFTAIVFFFIPIPLTGFIFMLASKKNQRLGDIIGNTIVIKKPKIGSLNETIFKVVPKDYTPVFSNVLRLSDNDIGIIKEAVDNSLKYNNTEYLQKVADKVKDLLHIDSKMSPKKFLDTIVLDYNHLALENEKE